MLDSNAMDAHPSFMDPGHNICGPNNGARADCSANGGPSSTNSCSGWFDKLWNTQKEWLKKGLSESTADWQVAVTHFPFGFEMPIFWSLWMYQGLDLLVIGHTHDQQLWDPSRMGGATCFVTGGGGGITSEDSPKGEDSNQDGFFDLAISKESTKIELINYNGVTIGERIIQPRHKYSQGQAGGSR